MLDECKFIQKKSNTLFTYEPLQQVYEILKGKQVLGHLSKIIFKIFQNTNTNNKIHSINIFSPWFLYGL